MAYILTIYTVDPGDKTIKVAHQFFGLDKKECLDYKEEHFGHCEYSGPAETEGRNIESWEEIPEDELPVGEPEP